MTDLEDLKLIAQARYEHQRQTLTRIVFLENELRAELTRIAALDRASPDDPSNVEQMQTIGADILWQGWLSRSKSTLNSELARVLAAKARELDRVRSAFGKLNALKDLIQQQTREHSKKRTKSMLDDAIIQSLKVRGFD